MEQISQRQDSIDSGLTRVSETVAVLQDSFIPKTTPDTTTFRKTDTRNRPQVWRTQCPLFSSTETKLLENKGSGKQTVLFSHWFRVYHRLGSELTDPSSSRVTPARREPQPHGPPRPTPPMRPSVGATRDCGTCGC